MSEDSTMIRIPRTTKKELGEVKEFLQDEVISKPSYGDCVLHLLRFWQQKREDKNHKQKQGPAKKG